MASSSSPKITTAQAAAHGDEAERALLSLRAYRIPQVCEKLSLGRSSVYAAIKSGELVARKWHRCTVVLAEDLEAFLRSLPQHR
jgi:hypothetical protein